MPRPPPLTIILVVLGLAGLRTAGDELLYRYECDVVPYDPSAGWLDGLCEYPCSESLADGHFILEWPFAGDFANYHYWIARPPVAPPHPVGRVALPLEPSFWSEFVHVRW